MAPYQLGAALRSMGQLRATNTTERHASAQLWISTTSPADSDLNSPERCHKLNTMAVAGLCAAIIRRERPRKMFIDVGGLGAGVVDRLRELGFGGKPVIAIKDHGGAVYRRAEMWSEMRDWFERW